MPNPAPAAGTLPRPQVYRPRGAFNALLWAIDVSMLLVCAAATIGAVRDIINAWSTYKIFGD